MDKAVQQAFSRGADKAKQDAVAYVEREVKIYKDKRYANDKSLLDVGDKLKGVGNFLHDNFTSMPPEYYQIYRDGRARYIAAIEQVLHEVAQLVGQWLKKAHEEVWR